VTDDDVSDRNQIRTVAFVSGLLFHLQRVLTERRDLAQCPWCGGLAPDHEAGCVYQAALKFLDREFPDHARWPHGGTIPGKRESLS
jgi:hypothetical protein